MLKKLDDKYNYDGVNFPTSHADIERFEENNQVAVFVYCLGDDGSVINDKKGNREHVMKSCLYLLRVEKDDKSHYIYIKNIGRLLNLHTHVQDKNIMCCPYCEGKIPMDKFHGHIKDCHKQSAIAKTF